MSVNSRLDNLENLVRALITRAGAGSGVTSVFGRTGAVTAATNDYTWAQIDKTTSSIANITTRSAADLSSGDLAAARMTANLDSAIRTAISGSASQVLRRNSGNSALEFATLSSGSVTLVSAQTLAADDDVVTFSSISTDYYKLVLSGVCRCDDGSDRDLLCEINDDTTGTNYSTKNIVTNGTSVTTQTIAGGTAGGAISRIQGGGTLFTVFEATFFKPTTAVHGGVNSHSTLDDDYGQSHQMIWKNTSAKISKLELTCSAGGFKTGDTFVLWGYS